MSALGETSTTVGSNDADAAAAAADDGRRVDAKPHVDCGRRDVNIAGQSAGEVGELEQSSECRLSNGMISSSKHVQILPPRLSSHRSDTLFR